MKIEYVPLGGGLDFTSSSTVVKPGRAADSLNFEQSFGRQGYRRVDGYERFDGRAQPHEAEYHVVGFSGGSNAVVAGDSIFGSTGEGFVLSVEVESGDWIGGTATGRIMYAPVAGSWVPGLEIRKGSMVGPLVGTASAASYVGRASSSEQHFTFLRQAQALRRQAIQKVPGEGPVRGVTVFNETVIAFRDAVGGASSTMWKATPSGWAQVRAGLLPGGSWEFAVTNFSGDAAKSALYGVDGRNMPFKWDGDTYTEIGPVFGSEASSVTSNTIGTGSKTFSVTGAAHPWAVGERLTVYSSSSGAQMTGTVSAYAHPSLTLNVTSTTGTGTFTDWRIMQADRDDRPYLIAAHKDHLFLVYPRGQLQSSNLGDPLAYSTSAVLLGVGEEITGLASLKGAVLGVFCDNKIHMLEGSSKADWKLSLHAKNVGARLYTVQENAGNAVMLSKRGLVSLQATQNFGGFEPATWSRDVKGYLDERMKEVVTTRMVHGKYQLRLYFSDGTVMSACITTPNAAIDPRDVAFMLSKYEHVAASVGSGDIDGEEAMFIGTTDGWVMREDVGMSFDGNPIYSYVRLHFNHLKAPANKKRFHKLVIEAESPDQVAVRFLQLFDLSDGEYTKSITTAMQTAGEGGRWNGSDWNEFYWSRPAATQAEANVDGIGRNMSLLIWTESDIQHPITMQGILLHYQLLGMTR